MASVLDTLHARSISMLHGQDGPQEEIDRIVAQLREAGMVTHISYDWTLDELRHKVTQDIVSMTDWTDPDEIELSFYAIENAALEAEMRLAQSHYDGPVDAMVALWCRLQEQVRCLQRVTAQRGFQRGGPRVRY